MINQLQAILQPGTQDHSNLPVTSRYHGVGTATLETAEGRVVIYLRRRLIPPPEHHTVLLEHTVTQGDRLDNLAARYLGDPEQFWRLCDANGALNPNQLTAHPGRTLRITLPAGLPGGQNA